MTDLQYTTDPKNVFIKFIKLMFFFIALQLQVHGDCS